MTIGRFAPSPTGTLHLGNLRTGLLAFMFARTAGSRFRLRFEDLDGAVRPEHYESQAHDLRRLGIEWDGEPLRQSDRMDAYRHVIAQLEADGLTYPCFCSRREIREATQAPNGPSTQGLYPGTCRRLTARERRAKEDEGRPPALRIRTASGSRRGFDDLIHGRVEHDIDDFVVQRNDGAPAYNLIAVIDDHYQGVEQVVRADDILSSTPRQILIHELLGLPIPSYAHVPLVLAPTGKRLAKRDGATTLDDRLARGETVEEVRDFLLASVNQQWGSLNPTTIPTAPTTLPVSYLGAS